MNSMYGGCIEGRNERMDFLVPKKYAMATDVLSIAGVSEIKAVLLSEILQALIRRTYLIN
jgi:hypothetical protein